MTRRLAILTIIISALFLMVAGIWFNSQQLFFMSTMMGTGLLALRLQTWLATRNLKFQRIAPTVLVAGDQIVMRIRVWSLQRMKRPLLIVTDELPPDLKDHEALYSLPIAPEYGEPVDTQYTIRPRKRGIYRWSRVRVESVDSLGLLSSERTYEAEPIEVIVHPPKIPFALDVTTLRGWGPQFSDVGRQRGPGMEPWGVRGYLPGDPLRAIHWRSTARTGTLQVKEFETGSQNSLFVFLQLTEGTEFGQDTQTTLEAMCGHAAYLADVMLNRGSQVFFPAIEKGVHPAPEAGWRFRQICDALAGVKANRQYAFARDLLDYEDKFGADACIVLMLTVAEPGLAEVIRKLANQYPLTLFIYNLESFGLKESPQTRTPVAPHRLVTKGKGKMTPATHSDFLQSVSLPNVKIQILENPFTAYAHPTKH